MARKQKTLVATIDVSPGDVIPIGLNWGPHLSLTADTIFDFVGTAPGLEIKDSWFADTYTNMLIGPIPRGRFTANFDIVTEADEQYHREYRIRCK